MRFIIGTFLLAMSTVLKAADIKLNEARDVYYSGAEVSISLEWESGEVQKGAWIGVFDGNGKYYNYVYWNPDASNYTLKLPNEPGDYEVRLATNNDGSEFVVKTASFKVAVAAIGQIVLKIDSPQVKPLQIMNIEVQSEVPLSTQGWIGVFKQGIPHQSRSGYETYQYLQDQRKFQFQAPESSGNYELRLFDDSYGNEVASIAFKVRGFSNINASLNTATDSFKPGETIAVDYSGHKDFATSAWIGVFDLNKVRTDNPHQGYTTYQYLPAPLKGSVAFSAPEQKGDYELRLFSSNYGEWVASKAFVVTESLDADYVERQIKEMGKVSLYGIYFDHDKSEIHSASEPTLQAVADYLRNHPGLIIEVQGHTDNTGKSGYNQTLSEQRAQSVVDYLTTNHAIPQGRLVAKGLGDTTPVAPNDTVDGRARNRRVDLLPVEL
ncbi:MAG: hypothetical protein CMK89_00730 [Pseudomonadales bacterium]|nr:hypothetical protein [Pseudomonadales bacterium]RLU02490.1 MAG: OmpA family protein [Ketobacter sp.]